MGCIELGQGFGREWVLVGLGEEVAEVLDREHVVFLDAGLAKERGDHFTFLGIPKPVEERSNFRNGQQGRLSHSLARNPLQVLPVRDVAQECDLVLHLSQRNNFLLIR